MNFKTTGVLLLLLMALSSGYWGMTRYEAGKQVHKEEAKRLFAFGPEVLREIEVRRIDEAPVAATQNNEGAWDITKPNANIEANGIVWDRLGIALAGLANERTIVKNTTDLAKYSLDKPVLTVAAKTASGEEIQIAFGAVEPTQTFRYALTKDGTIFLAAQKAFQEMDRPLSVLRDPYVLSLGKDDVTRLEFARFWSGKAPDADANRPDPGQESVVIVVEKAADGLWRLASPLEGLANQDVINELIKQVQFATGSKYIEDPKNLGDYGLNPPKARITLQAAGKPPQTLLLGSLESTGDGKKAGGLYAKNAAYPAVLVTDPTVLNLLPRTPDAFREARLLSHTLLDVQSIHYVAGETDITLENNADKGWIVTAPPGVDTDQVAVSNLFATLKALQGRGFPGDSKPEFGLDRPVVMITLNYLNNTDSGLKDKQPPAIIRIGAPTEDKMQYYAMQDNGIVTMLNQLDVTAITKPLFYFQKKNLMAFDKASVTRIVLTIDGTAYVFEKPRGKWLVKEPTGRTLDSPTDMDALIKALSSVTADAVESATPPSDRATFGLDAPAASVAVTVSKGDSASEIATIGPLVIGEPSPDDSQARYATSPLLPGVYRVGQSLLDEIRESLKNIR